MSEAERPTIPALPDEWLRFEIGTITHYQEEAYRPNEVRVFAQVLEGPPELSPSSEAGFQYASTALRRDDESWSCKVRGLQAFAVGSVPMEGDRWPPGWKQGIVALVQHTTAAEHEGGPAVGDLLDDYVDVMVRANSASGQVRTSWLFKGCAKVYCDTIGRHRMYRYSSVESYSMSTPLTSTET